MFSIVISRKNYPERFLKEKLPAFIKNYMLQKVNENKKFYVSMDKYLKQYFKISLHDAIEICCNNYKCTGLDENFATFEPDNNSYYKNIKIITLMSFIDNGNLSIKGVNLFSDIIRKIKEKPYKYFQFYMVTKGSKIWQ